MSTKNENLNLKIKGVLHSMDQLEIEASKDFVDNVMNRLSNMDLERPYMKLMTSVLMKYAASLIVLIALNASVSLFILHEADANQDVTELKNEVLKEEFLF